MTKLTVALRNFTNVSNNYFTDNTSGQYIWAHVRKTGSHGVLENGPYQQ